MRRSQSRKWHAALCVRGIQYTTMVTPEANYPGAYTTNITPRKQTTLSYDITANYMNRFQTSYFVGNVLAAILNQFQLRSHNPDETHSVSVKRIGNWIIFVYMNPDWVATDSGFSSFHFSCWIKHSIQNEISIWNHVNLTWIPISLCYETRNEIDVRYGRNRDCLQNGKFYSRI